MKKFYFILLAMILPMIAFTACSDIESDAKEQMQKTIKNLAKDPDTQISDTKAMFKTDSLIVLHCVVRGKNGFGGYTRNDMEYIYGIFKDNTRMESLQNLDEKESILKTFARIYKEDHPNDKSPDSKTIEIGVTMQLAFFGREIEEE